LSQSSSQQVRALLSASSLAQIINSCRMGGKMQYLNIPAFHAAGIPALLSPGNKAAEKIFERDARSGRKR
jgi:hypothetical protein